MAKTVLTLPDGRSMVTASEKRYHVVIAHRKGLVRASSSDSRQRALSSWRSFQLAKAWVIDGVTGEYVRTPDSPRLKGSTR
jgi:hypothetical protein